MRGVKGLAAMQHITQTAIDAIGNTPLMALDRLHPGPGRLLAKAEFLNPGGSIKDRPARQIILDAKTTGKLKDGQPVVEMTSGNMGAGLAVVCAVLGHPFTAVMSAGNSPRRADMLRALGAKVTLIPQIDGKQGEVTGADVRQAAKIARNLAAQAGAYYVDQFHNAGSTRAHELSTGPEIWTQTIGKLDAFVAMVGSGGTFIGTARHLKSKSPSIQCYAVEPSQSRPLAGQPVQKHRHVIQGTGYGVVPPHWDADLADGLLAVSNKEVLAMGRRLGRLEGLHVGHSAAANVLAAQRLLDSGALRDDATVVTILCDTGLKY